MKDYLDYELSELIDLLAERTARYTNMLNDGFHHGEEFAHIGDQVMLIQQAIWNKMGFNPTTHKKDGES